MRIVHVIWSMATGGIETMLVDIVNEQVKSNKVRVYVINDYYNRELLQTIDSGVEVVLCNRRQGSRNPLPLVKFNISLLMYRPDVVHCHDCKLSSIIWLPFTRVLTIHNTHSTSKYYGNYKRLFCISEAVRNHIANQGFHDGIVVYNGIHTGNIVERTLCHKADNKSIHMVCVGRLHPDKGQRLIIEALRVLKDRHQVTTVSCDFVGGGAEHSPLENLAIRYGVADNVRFLGIKPRTWIYSHLKDYDLYVMPSISEGFGLTLAEACAAKVPVLTCDLEGPLEVVGGGRFGNIFKTGDQTSLANSIMRLLNNGIDEKMIMEAYDYVKRNFDVSHTAERYLREYESMLK